MHAMHALLAAAALLSGLAAAADSPTHPSVFISPEDLGRITQAEMLSCTYERVSEGEATRVNETHAMRDVLALLHARATKQHDLNRDHLANAVNNSETLVVAVEASNWDRRFIIRSSLKKDKIDYLLVPSYQGT